MSKSLVVRIIIYTVFLLGLLAIWYDSKYSMGITSEESYGSLDAQYRVLIATQQSEYKDILTNEIIDELRSKDVYIMKCDVTQLPSKKSELFDAILLIHTWEVGKPPVEVIDFIGNTHIKDKIYTICTSGSGDEKITYIDGISGASVKANMTDLINAPISWIHKRIDN